MERKISSILKEIESISAGRDIQYVIESRAHNVITSAINLLETISKYYTLEQSQLLERKLLNAIRSRNYDRFVKSMRKTKDDE